MGDETILCQEDLDQLKIAARARKLLEEDLKKVDAAEEALKEKCLEAMRTKGVSEYQDDEIKITYVKPFERKTFDSKKFMAENPNMGDAYMKTSTIRESVKVTYKNTKGE